METLAFSHLACSEENSNNQEFTVCVDFKKLSSVSAMSILSTATIVGGMSMTADSASAYSGYGYGNDYNYSNYSNYGRSSGYYYKKVVVRSYDRSYGSYGNYGNYGSYGRYDDYNCYY